MFDIYYYGRNAGRLSMIKNLTLWETTKELNFSGAIDFNGIFELADSETPALLIIDLEYEDPNYYDLLDRVIGSHLLPSILFTKDNSFNGARHLFLLGADDCLPSGESQKISESRLSQSIVHVCRNHESQIFSNEMNDLISTLTETIFAGKNDCSPIVLGIIEQFYQKYSDSVELRIALAKTFVYIYQLILQKNIISAVFSTLVCTSIQKLIFQKPERKSKMAGAATMRESENSIRFSISSMWILPHTESGNIQSFRSIRIRRFRISQETFI